MTLDHLREIALIQISQAQRTNAMTAIDTTLYANGALRLSRHGAGKGGNVLVHVADSRQLEPTDLQLSNVISDLEDLESAEDALAFFNDLWRWHAPIEEYRKHPV